jgi:hypothetical protein
MGAGEYKEQDRTEGRGSTRDRTEQKKQKLKDEKGFGKANGGVEISSVHTFPYELYC